MKQLQRQFFNFFPRESLAVNVLYDKIIARHDHGDEYFTLGLRKVDYE